MIEVGQLQQDATIPARLDVDEMLSKHFAVLGTTGVGKSSAVTLLLHQILTARPDLRVLLLDVHNEYSRCFGPKAQVLNPSNIKLPFWLYNFDEIVDVFFGGRPGLEEEVDILSEVIPLAKAALRAGVVGRTAGAEDRRRGRALHARRAGALSHRRSSGAARFAHGQARKPLVAHGLSQADHAHRDDLQRSALRLHVRERQCRRRHDGGDPLDAVPPAAERRADDDHAIGRFPLRGRRRRGVGHLPDGLRSRAVERRRRPAAGRLRGGASLHVGRSQRRLRADPPRHFAHRQGRPQIRRVPRPGHAAAGGARIQRSCRNARRCSPCA